MKVLVIFSHSYQERSLANLAILEEFKKADFAVRNLEELYPDGNIDVASEQAALLGADLVLFQHPIYWFNVTSMLKKWQDEVLQYGFAFGSEGDKLHGKKFLHSFTTGSPYSNYSDGLYQTLSASVVASASFCGMEVLEPMGVYGLGLTHPNPAEEAREHALKVINFVKSLA